MKKVNLIRYTLFFSGLMILTLGARIILLSEMGTGGIDAFVFGLSRLFGMSMGAWFNIIGVIEIIIGCLLRKKSIQIGPIFCAILVGLLFDLWGIILFNHLPSPSGDPIKGIVFLVGLIVTPLGTSLYILPGITTGSLDFLMLAIKMRFKCSLVSARTLLEVIFLISAILVKGPIGIGTVLIMLLFGPILQFYYKHAKNLVIKMKLKGIIPKQTEM